MKLRYKYFGTAVLYLLLYLLAAVPFLLAGYLVNGVFALLCEELPEVFRSASFTKDPEGYRLQVQVIAALTASIALFVLNVISGKLDNKRQEYVISMTDGRYTLPEGLRLYLKSFLLSDVIAAVIPPMLIAVPAALVPEWLLDYGLRFPMWMNVELNAAFDPITGAAVLILLSVLMRLFSVPTVLSGWRAEWLAASGEGV